MRIKADVDELLELVSSVTEAYTTAFFLADNRRRELNLWRFYSLSNNVTADAIIPFGTGPIGRVAESGQPFILSKFSERDSGLLRLYSRSEDIKSFFAVPVMTEDTLEGVLCIDSKKTFVFASREQKLLTLFAKQFANLLDNLRVQKFVDTEVSDVAFLHDFCFKIVSTGDVESISKLTLDSVAHLVSCNSCFLGLRTGNEDGEVRQYRIEAAHSHRNAKGMTFSDQDGLAGCVIRGRESFLLSNRKKELGSYVFTPSESVGSVTSFLGVPLLTEADVQGLICLIDSEEDFFNQRDLRVVSIIAGSASLAISNAKAQRRSRELSTSIDGLTGLCNYSGFQEKLEAAFQEAYQKRRPLSLVIIDLDNFRKINDTSGYKTGDRVLKEIARLLMDLGRDYSISAARYGSDDFVLVLPGTTKERAALIAEMLRREVEDPTFIAPSQGVHTSINIGVSSFPQDSESCRDLVNNALRVLSADKASRKGKAASHDTFDVKLNKSS